MWRSLIGDESPLIEDETLIGDKIHLIGGETLPFGDGHLQLEFLPPRGIFSVPSGVITILDYIKN